MIRQSYCENMCLREYLGEEHLDRGKVLMSIAEIVFQTHAGVN